MIIPQMNWKLRYMPQALIDVTNWSEFGVMCSLGIITFFLFIVFYQSFQNISKQKISRIAEKEDLILIKFILILNALSLSLSYFIESSGIFLYQNCKNNDYYIIAIIYCFFNILSITTLQLLCWRSSILWGQLLCLKLKSNFFNNTINQINRFHIIEIVVIFGNSTMFILYLFQRANSLNYIISIVQMIILIIFIIVSIFFQKIVLTQPDIPILSKRRIRISILFLTFALLLRLIWNICLTIKAIESFLDFIKNDEEENEQNQFCQEDKIYWTIYLIVYSLVADVIPIILFNRIYSPSIQHKQRKLLDIQ